MNDYISNHETLTPICNIKVVGIGGGGNNAVNRMVNAGIKHVSVFTNKVTRSLPDHLGSGKPWDLDRKNQGLNILPPNLADLDYGRKRGNIDKLWGAKSFLRKSLSLKLVKNNYLYIQKKKEEHYMLILH